MKIKQSFKKNIFSLIFITCALSLYAESFRVSKLHTAEVSQIPNSQTEIQLGINDSLAVKLPENQDFLEGLEFNFSIPESVAYTLDSVSCSVYVDLKPVPDDSQIDYTGTKVFVRNLPNKLSWVLQIPLKEENNLKSNNYTQTINAVTLIPDNIIFIRLQPVVKGLQESVLNTIIPVTIKPILINKGKLNLTFSPANDEDLQPCSVFIDDEMVDVPPSGEILLETGIHNISVISEYYRNEVRTVRIEQGSQTDLNINFKSIEPTLYITAPEGTIVKFDEKVWEELGKECIISEGQHQLTFTIGDYEMVRNIDAIKGKTYKAAFTLDLDISEE